MASHLLLSISFAPSSTTLPLYVTTTQCLRKYTPHPASVSCTTDTSDRDANPGMTWPIPAVIGSCGRSGSRTCVDFSVEPSGIVTVTGFFVGVTFVAVASMTRKWLVAPESSTAQSLLFSFLTS